MVLCVPGRLENCEIFLIAGERNTKLFSLKKVCFPMFPKNSFFFTLDEDVTKSSEKFQEAHGSDFNLL